jgi:hypothetical protein
VNRLKTFQQFVNEALDDHSIERALDIFPTINEQLFSLLKQVQTQADHMMDRNNYWYNRESRNFNEDHYAINVKTYSYPDVDEWREAIGDEDASEEQMWDHWSEYLRLEIEDFEENVFLEEFGDTFEKILMGGRSGGWMCIVPDKSPDVIIEDLETYVDSYIDTLSDLDQNDIEELESLLSLSDEEKARTIEFGLVKEPAIYEQLMSDYHSAYREAEEALSALNRHEAACKFVQEKHDEFEKDAEVNFLENEKQNYV